MTVLLPTDNNSGVIYHKRMRLRRNAPPLNYPDGRTDSSIPKALMVPVLPGRTRVQMAYTRAAKFSPSSGIITAYFLTMAISTPCYW